jgi:Ca2+/H+ antiporter, TMEM165/GDT1 family
VGGVTALLFAVGAVLLWRESKEPGDESTLTTSESLTDRQTGPGTAASIAPTTTRLRTVLLTSFVTVGLAEWGDLTQLATASLAADRGDPFGVGIGAYVALLSVAALAAFTGRWIVRVVPLQMVRRVAAALFAGLALWTLFELR